MSTYQDSRPLDLRFDLYQILISVFTGELFWKDYTSHQEQYNNSITLWNESCQIITIRVCTLVCMVMRSILR